MFYISLVIGILALVSIFIIDDIYDGLMPALGAFFVSFGAIGLISSSISSGDGVGVIFFVLTSVISLGLAIATFFLFRLLRRGAERVAEPVTIGDVVSSKGHVIWWSEEGGEVSLTVRGEMRTVQAVSDEKLEAGDNVLVIHATSVNNVRVVRY